MGKSSKYDVKKCFTCVGIASIVLAAAITAAALGDVITASCPAARELGLAIIIIGLGRDIKIL